MQRRVIIAACLAAFVLVICSVGYYVSDRSTTVIRPTALPTPTQYTVDDFDEAFRRQLETDILYAILTHQTPEPSETQQEIDRLLDEIPNITAEPASWITPDPATVAREYILNKNTKVFHDPQCRYASNIDAANKETVWQTRDELISAGYDPCGVCEP